MQRKIPYLIVNFWFLGLLIFHLLGFLSNPWFCLLILVSLLVNLVYCFNYAIIFVVVLSLLDIVELFQIKVGHWVSLFVYLILFYRFLKLTGQKRCRSCLVQQTKVKEILAFVKFYYLHFKQEFLRIYKMGHFFFNFSFLLVLTSFIGLINAKNLFFSLKQTFVLIVVLGIIFLIYWWIINKHEGLEQVIKGLIFSSPVILFYAIYQNIAHELGVSSFELMPARPNGPFFEPDWLGMYLIFLIAVIFPLLLNQRIKLKPSLNLEKKNLNLEEEKLLEKKSLLRFLNLKISLNFLFFTLFLAFVVLIITVARSAWLSFGVMFLLFCFFILINGFLKKGEQFQSFANALAMIVKVGFILGLAVFTVRIFKLTRFNLQDRFLSAFNKEHIVTMAQKDDQKFQIDLEKIDYYQKQGYKIIEEKVKDINVVSREMAYASNWEMVKEHSILGQGQGSTLVLRNYVYNASNLFFEWWISAGLLGLLAFLGLLFGLLKQTYNYWLGKDRLILKELKHLAKNDREKDYDKLGIYNLMIILGLSGLFICNWFNSGIFFLPLWFYLAMMYAIFDKIRKFKIQS